MKAYVLIQTSNRSQGIVLDLRSLPGVVEADALRGPYDAIALVDPASTGRPVDEVLEDIRELPWVTRALMAPVVSSLPTEGYEAA